MSSGLQSVGLQRVRHDRATEHVLIFSIAGFKPNKYVSNLVRGESGECVQTSYGF